MRLYAVVIGSERPYVARAIDPPYIAVYERRKDAEQYRKSILQDCGHREVYVRRFEYPSQHP